MFVDSSVTRLNGKTYARHLLRETYREDGKVKHRTLANLTHCKSEEVEAIRLALKYKGDLGRMLASAGESGPELKQGPSVGAVWVLSQLARELGVVMRVVEGDAGPEIAMSFIERLPQDPRAALDIGAEIIAQRPIGGVGRGAPMPGDFSNPCIVNLHGADVDRAVGILADLAHFAGLDAEQQHQHPRRDLMQFGRSLETALDHGFVRFCRGEPERADHCEDERRA